MSVVTTRLPNLDVIATAHEDTDQKQLLLRFTAASAPVGWQEKPMKVAIVLDRSGSMSGDKIAIARAAAGRFIRSLGPDDLVSLVVYDDQVDLLAPLAAPSEPVARLAEQIDVRGSTDLYGGWLAGAKSVGRGGRVILLSDGQANQGRYQDAQGLMKQAATSYQEYGVTTSTIGVGQDYDEGIMAGMARAGAGSHYFARDASAIMDAFSQERYSAGAVLLERATIAINGKIEQLGHFWAGETKSRVFPLHRLEELTLSVRYTDNQTALRTTHAVQLPASFGYSEEVRLEALLQRAADAEEAMLSVRDPESAARGRERLRTVVLALLAHPSSDEPHVRAVIDRLRASIDRLSELERNYNEQEAMMHRKRSMQSSHNLRERSKAYSSFEDDRLVISHLVAPDFGVRQQSIQVDTAAFTLVPREQWMQWRVAPVAVSMHDVRVAMENPRDGFLISEMTKVLGRRVSPIYAGCDGNQLVEHVRQAP